MQCKIYSATPYHGTFFRRRSKRSRHSLQGRGTERLSQLQDKSRQVRQGCSHGACRQDWGFRKRKRVRAYAISTHYSTEALAGQNIELNST